MLVNIGLDSKKRALPLKFSIKNKKHPAIVRQSTSIRKTKHKKYSFLM